MLVVRHKREEKYSLGSAQGGHSHAPLQTHNVLMRPVHAQPAQPLPNRTHQLLYCVTPVCILKKNTGAGTAETREEGGKGGEKPLLLYCVTPVCILKKKHRARHG